MQLTIRSRLFRAVLAALSFLAIARASSAAPCQSGDDCTAPSFVTPAVPVPFDLTSATTSTSYPFNPLCAGGAGPIIERDRWYVFLAPASETEITFCGTTSADVKIAVYEGLVTGQCPTIPAIACIDNLCGLQPRVCFQSIPGVPYMLQLGVPLGGAPGSGTFRVDTGAASSSLPDRHDDGTAETSIGLGAAGTFAWLARFGASSALPSTSVRAILVAYGTPSGPAGSPPNGTPSEVALWEDPNDDGDPNDAVLLARVATTIQSTSTNTFVRVPLPEAVSVSGRYFIGAVVTHAPNQYPAAFDQSSCPTHSLGRAWYAGSTGAFDFDVLSANSTPPTDMDVAGLPGVWLLRPDTGRIAAGSNLYVTPPGTTFADFTTPLPAGFFGPGSQPFASRVVFAGAPLAGTGSLLGADTILERLNPCYFPWCPDFSLVDVRILALSLVGGLPISFGTTTSTYQIDLTLSSAGTQGLGTSTLTRNRPDGGTLSWSIPVQTRIVFTRVTGTSGLPSVVLDPGPTLTLQASGVHWSFSDEGLGLGVSAGGTVDHDGVPGTPEVPYPASGDLYVGVWRPGATCAGGGGPAQLDESYEQANDFQHGLLPAGSAVLGGNFGYGFGHSTMTPCPCGNTPAASAAAGCLHSLGTGARLSLSGLASVSSDDLVLSGSGMPNSSALYFQGTFHASAGAAFGDGRRVATGTVIRLGTKTNSAGASQYPSAGDQPISVRGAIPQFGGVTRNYQVWYRNAATFCTSSTFNLSNGYQVAWQF